MNQIYTNWQDTGINLKGRVAGQFKTQCPQCSESRNNKKDTCLSVNIDEKVWQCHNCTWHGGITNVTHREPKKEYKKPEFTPQTPTDKMATWFLSKRGIEAETLTKFMVSPKQSYIHKAGKVVDCIAFPYIRGTDIINIKSRYDYTDNGERKKTFALEKDAELIFYNLNAIEKESFCVIVEGEIDCMVVWQETQYPCVSVPNGASKGDNKMEYLDNCFEYFTNKKTIVLATDNDEPGLQLREALARRLGKDRCYYIQYPEGCKDVNEVLLKYGNDGICNLFVSLHPFPIDGVISLDSVEDEFDNYYHNGYPKGLKTGLAELDDLITWRGGEVTTLTGIPGHGKSELLDEVLTRLAVEHDCRTGLFAAENGSAALHYGRIAHRYIGKPFYRWDWKMSEEELAKAKLFISDKFFFINRKEVKTDIDSLLEKAREMVLRKGINIFVIDPYNCMESNRPANVNETEYVSQIYDKMVNFAELYNVHVILVAHPTKMKRNEKTNKFEVPTMYSISGSANFYNKTFNGIAVYRDFQAHLTTVYVQKVKFDFIGKTGFANFTFNQDKRRYEPAVVVQSEEEEQVF